MNKFGSFILTNWYKGINGFFKYNIIDENNKYFNISLYYDLGSISVPLDNNKIYDWSIRFSNDAAYLDPYFRNKYGIKFTGTAEEVKETVDSFLEKMNNLLVFT